MPLDDAILQRVQDAARERRASNRAGSSPIGTARRALAGVIDVGTMSDSDVMAAYGAYLAVLHSDTDASL